MLKVFPKRATMIVAPGEPDVTTPCDETPATPGSVEDHVTLSPGRRRVVGLAAVTG